jgi:Flp pilus assembly pilin Flp
MLNRLLHNDEGQDIAEYAVLLAVLLAIVIVVLQAIGNGENTLFSQVASKLASVM